MRMCVCLDVCVNARAVRFSVFADTDNTCCKREDAFPCECDKTHRLLLVLM